MTIKKKFRLNGRAKDSYLDLIVAFPLASIRSDEHLVVAQKFLDQLVTQIKLDEGSQMYLDALSDLVAAYEDEHHPIEPATDADMLRHLMEARGSTQIAIHRETGIPKSTISDVLAGNKPFSRKIIRKLADFFGIEKSMLTGNL